MNTLLKGIVKPLLSHMTKNLTDEEIWAKEACKIPSKALGPGCKHEWSWYLEGKSTVEVHSVADIVDWLRGCRYMGDRVLFNEIDFWQHPVTFENLRKGDCEDHALWAWRKLRELGIPGELVFGRSGPAAAKGNQAHAWVHVELNGQLCLMETVADARHQMTFPLEEVRTSYCPAFSVDTQLRTYQYGGALECARLQMEALSAEQ